MADFAAYRWLDPLHAQTHFAVAACVTVVRGLDVAETVLAFGGDPSLPPQPLRSFEETGYYLEVAAVGQLDDVVVAVEPNGFQGSRPEVLRVASRMGDAVSVYWNVNLNCRFSYSVRGELVTSFDPLHTEWRSGSDPDRLLGEMATLPFGIDNDPIPAAFVLSERLTGRALSRKDIEGVTNSWRLVPLLGDLYPRRAEDHFLRYDDGELVDLVAGAGSEVQRELAAVAAEQAAAACGFDREPGVRAALAGLRTTPGEPLSPEVAELVRQLIHRSSVAWSAVSFGHERETSEVRELSRSANAANALYQATNPDPLAAALDALSSARHVIGEDLLEQARALCG